MTAAQMVEAGNEEAFAGGFRLWDPEAPAQIVA